MEQNLAFGFDPRPFAKLCKGSNVQFAEIKILRNTNAASAFLEWLAIGSNARYHVITRITKNYHLITLATDHRDKEDIRTVARNCVKYIKKNTYHDHLHFR